MTSKSLLFKVGTLATLRHIHNKQKQLDSSTPEHQNQSSESETGIFRTINAEMPYISMQTIDERIKANR